MVVQHNAQAMNANRMLNITVNQTAKSTEKLSSGYRINRAADDAAGLSISEGMRSQIRGLTQASRNAQDGISYVQTAEGAYNEVTDMLQRMNELAVQAANGTNTTTQRGYINDEIVALKQEINRIGSDTKFNGLSAFGSTISFHVGSENTTAAQINVTTAKLTCEALGLSSMYFVYQTVVNPDFPDAGPVYDASYALDADTDEALKYSNSVLTQDEARAFLDTISAALSTVSGWRSDLGAIQNRLEYAIKNLDNVVENTATAESRIRDTDMSTEMVSYSNNQILAQAGQAMLAQANQANQGVLSLL